MDCDAGLASNDFVDILNDGDKFTRGSFDLVNDAVFACGGDDVYSIGYEELIAPLIKAVQQLSARVAELEAS